MNDIYNPNIAAGVVRAVDNALAAEVQVTGMSSEEILRSDRIEQVANFAVTELVTPPITAQKKIDARHFVGVELGIRMSKRR